MAERGMGKPFRGDGTIFAAHHRTGVPPSSGRHQVGAEVRPRPGDVLYAPGFVLLSPSDLDEQKVT